MNLINQKVIALCVISFSLTACGGGGSSSGAEQAKDLTACVAESVVETPVSAIVTNLTTKAYTYTNNCGVPVNLSTADITSTTDIATITLAVGGVHTDTSIIGIKYIACRPPSVGIDANTSLVLIQFGCS